MDLDADIDIMLADFGEDVTFSGVTAKGIPFIEDGPVLGSERGQAIGRKILVKVRRSAFSQIPRGSVVTFRGQTWNVIDFASLADGKVLDLALERVRP